MILIPCVITSLPEGDDKTYMEWLYRTHCRLMYATAWKLIRDPEDVRDIVSESCLRLIAKISLLRTLEEHQLKSYIASTVRNLSITHLVRLNRGRIAIDQASEDTPLPADCEGPEGDLLLQEELDRVWAAVEQLPEPEQTIMRLKYELDLSTREIAEQTGLMPGSVSKRLNRARNFLKKRLYASEKEDR